LERAGDIALPARRLARLLHQIAVFLNDRARTALFGLDVVPVDLEPVTTLLRRPEAFADDSVAARNLDDVHDPRHGLGRA